MVLRKLKCKLGFHDSENILDKWEGYVHYTLEQCKYCGHWHFNIGLGLPPRIKEKAEKMLRVLNNDPQS
jgi:hypothetical protein